METFYLFFQGTLSFQVIVFIILFFVTKRKDLLFYALFLFFAAVYFLINAPFTFFGIPEEEVWNSVWYDFANTPIIIIENLFYLLFLKTFFADITSDKNIHRVFRFTLWLIPCVAAIFILLTILKMDKQFIFYTVNLIAVIPALAITYVVLKTRAPFGRLVANGIICTTAGTCITVCMIILRNSEVHHLFTDDYPLFFIRLGILGDMIFLIIAILKKWHLQEKQLVIEKLKSHLATERLRNTISAELHDDLGSTVSGISMYSYMVSDMLRLGNYEKAKQSIIVIQKSASQIARNLDDLVWCIDPGKDSLKTLAERLEEYANEMCLAKNISFDSNWQIKNASDSLSMKQRRELYLLLKESINNAVKYSNATAIELTLKEDNCVMIFSVKDNGKGFDVQKIKRGNGLNNMQRRADEIDASLLIQSNYEQGTVISLQCKIT